MQVRAHVLIEGEVQGVFFRANIQELALECGVKGWIRNLENDKVEAVFEGEKEKVDSMIDFCKRGPPGTRVISFEIKWEEFKNEFKDFQIKYR